MAKTSLSSPLLRAAEASRSAVSDVRIGGVVPDRVIVRTRGIAYVAYVSSCETLPEISGMLKYYT